MSDILSAYLEDRFSLFRTCSFGNECRLVLHTVMLAWSGEIGAVIEQCLTEVWLVIHRDIILSDKSHHFSLAAFYVACRWCSNPHCYDLPWGRAHWFQFHLLHLLSYLYSPILSKVLEMFSFGWQVRFTHKKHAFGHDRSFAKTDNRVYWMLFVLGMFSVRFTTILFPLMCPTSKIFTV